MGRSRNPANRALTFTAAALALMTVALFASIVPALRATRYAYRTC
jgi:hypothetical protein